MERCSVYGIEALYQCRALPQWRDPVDAQWLKKQAWEGILALAHAAVWP